MDGAMTRLLEEWVKAKREKNYAQADAIRTSVRA